ncbi:hypothetical protein E1A91_D03G186400v1 [Gossypium mustelinum]|uniref:Uncharacterized protein n=1 Tax=Gossypium mustelinum TaxID=34275 RepID=A0A5D2VQ62_GOSMU|nr:hypothetical protein E1A91_D03G186400v1 [Gossypium mustelinum]
MKKKEKKKEHGLFEGVGCGYQTCLHREDNKPVDDLTSMAWRQTLQSSFYYSPQVALLD